MESNDQLMGKYEMLCILAVIFVWSASILK